MLDPRLEVACDVLHLQAKLPVGVVDKALDLRKLVFAHEVKVGDVRHVMAAVGERSSEKMKNDDAILSSVEGKRKPLRSIETDGSVQRRQRTLDDAVQSWLVYKMRERVRDVPHSYGRSKDINLSTRSYFV